jgi:predicted enzyme related to lactoylglutathione lyase
MLMDTAGKEESKKCGWNAGNIVWFEIPADDVERARGFYAELFGWTMERFPGPMDYWHIKTGGADGAPDGGLLKRQNAGHVGITNYLAVASVEEASAKVTKLGGVVCMPKSPVPGMGYFAICQDPEKNMFALWEADSNAK